MLWLPHSLAPTPDLGDTLVWIVRDADAPPEWVTDPDALNEAERSRAANLRHPLAHSQFVRGRAILRSALALWLNVAPRKVPIQLTPDGKPYLDAADVHFNISHTAGFALFGIGRRPIGVDIERANPQRDCDGLVKRYFTPPEQEQYFLMPESRRPAAFLRGWTCKEALLKAIGSGVRDLQNCRLNLNPDEAPTILAAPGEGFWELKTGEVELGVAWAVATAFQAGVKRNCQSLTS